MERAEKVLQRAGSSCPIGCGLIVRAMEKDASENPMLAISVEKLVLIMFAGEQIGDHSFLRTHRDKECYPEHDHHLCFDSDGGVDYQ